GLAQLPAGVAVMAPPVSPPRSADLFGVSLNVTAPHAAAPIGRIVPARLLAPAVAAPAAPAVAKPESATLAPGAAVHFHVDAGTLQGAKLTTTGNQVVRAVALNEFGLPVADLYIPAAQSAPLPAHAWRVVGIGEGAMPPVDPAAGGTARETIGV